MTMQSDGGPQNLSGPDQEEPHQEEPHQGQPYQGGPYQPYPGGPYQQGPYPGGPYRGVMKPPKPPSRPESAGAALAKLLVPLLVPLVFMLVIVPTGFLLEGPGPSFDLQEDLTVKGAQTYPSQGELLLTSVRLQEARLINKLLSLFDEDIEMMKIRDYLGEDLDMEKQETVDIVITFLSENTAVVVGLREVGIPVEVTELGLFVVDVGEDYPAYGLIHPGEVIVGVNGEAAGSVSRFTEVVASVPEGGTITLQVKETDAELADEVNEAIEEGASQRPDLAGLLEDGVREVQVRPVYSPELERPVIGVYLREYFTYSASVEVEWDLATVKGPSAGLMMTLSLVNTLTSDDLTGGEKIAGTGEILLDGDIGPIGGLPFKIRAAESEGAEVFIYPIENQEDLAEFTTDLELYAVDNLDEVLRVLQNLK